MHACVSVEEGCVSVTPAFVVSAFDGPSQAMEALQPTHALIITHAAADAHIRQTGSGLGISAVCVPSSAVFSHSFSLSLCFDVACVCQHHYQRRRRRAPIVFADGEVPRALFSAAGGGLYPRTVQTCSLRFVF